jgi:uncharacterized protein YjiS (DUF1127 family)
MAYSLSGERPAVAAVSTNPFVGFVTWLARTRAGRTRRIALASLLDFDDALLDDLGINRQDVVDALRHHPQEASGAMLHARRASRARSWFGLR